jgi:signal transduction histidine kinase
MDITTDIAPNVHADVDPDAINRALLSILANAVFAVNKKAKKKDYTPLVKLSLKPSGSHIEIRIYDNGIGIEETIIDKVFDPFFTTKTTGEAAGTGLYISREIIQNYGGDITVQSEKNKYTEFTITLPIL